MVIKKKTMKLGIMQPYFFPYIGYFQLIKAVDKWIVFDVVQYMRHHWLNRNRILHPNSGWQYITVPLQKYHREILIKDVLTKEGNEWKERIIAQLGHYKKKARYYNNTIEFVRECLFSTEKSCLARLNTEILKKICDHLCIDFDYSICSEMDLSFDGVNAPGEWALEISDQLSAEEYINPSSGREIFDIEKYAAKGVKLRFLTPNLREYKQKGYNFESGLSIIDVMMWNSMDEIKDMLCDYKLTQ